MYILGFVLLILPHFLNFFGYRLKKMHYMGLFSKTGNIFRQPRALQASNAMLQGNLSLTPSKIFVGRESPKLL